MRMIHIFLAFALTAILATAAPAWAQPEPTRPDLDFSALIEAARVPGPLEFCGEPVPLADPDVRERLEREMLLVLWDAPMVIMWLKRSGRHMGAIEAALRENGLPEDLKFIPVAESSLRPHIRSPKGAMGFWQFLAPTGRTYGLQVDSEKDQRRSLADSTQAALAYLRDLHGMFGSWTLAVAAYNMGEHGLMREIAAQEIRDYFRLYLPLETQRYIFRILAAKLILSDPGRYGFHLEPGDIYPPPEEELATVDLAETTPVLAVARAAGVDLKTIKDLNPDLRGYQLAPGRHRLHLPRDSTAGFPARLAEEARRIAESRQTIIYVVQEGDSLGAIAERFSVPLAEILRDNRLNSQKPIHPGQRLSITVRTSASEPES
jgi:membrane-bound lytic murein transglycosylase D